MIVLGVIGGLLRVALVGALTFVLALGVVSALLFIGGPEPALDCGGRAVVRSQALSDQFQTRWDVLDDGGDADSFDESEVSSRAFTFFDPERLREVTVCFEGGIGTATAEIDIEGLSTVLGDVRVRARGSADLQNGVPVVSISSLEIGSLPSFLAQRVATGPLEDALNEQLASVRSRQRYLAEMLDGSVEITRLGPPVRSN